MWHVLSSLGSSEPRLLLRRSKGSQVPFGGRQVHVEDCAVTGPRTRRATEDEARRWTVEVGACQFCRPDALLGVLE
ncbi:DUF6233 domain-containing protein [Streptomyces genisteinicus]|uniref:Uncharacterized protein n=1 Tax=Streptomyces genisteinicus TaxID=2768068 RepID=A0A7H0I5E4_9ACTN|nr:DUF6233 domain-containing protein [Streptomyces genisteinicus]QNP68010.1 hypothetical protein IAG43_34180 [Streptomyces genisteinicus]